MKWRTSIKKIPFDTCILLYMRTRRDETYKVYSGFKSENKDLGFMIFYNTEYDGGCCRECECEYLTPREAATMIKCWCLLEELEATLRKDNK